MIPAILYIDGDKHPIDLFEVPKVNDIFRIIETDIKVRVLSVTHNISNRDMKAVSITVNCTKSY